MPELSEVNGTELPTPIARAEPAWPAVFAFVMAWLMPATTARRTEKLSLWLAFGVHLLAAAGTLLLISFLGGIERHKNPFWLVGEIIEEIARHPLEGFVILAFTILGIELGFVLLALITLSWGAGDERLQTSFAAAMRQTWLHSSHALPVVLLVGLLLIGYEEASRNYRNDYPYPRHPSRGYPQPPKTPANAQPNSKAWKDYQTEMQEYQTAVQEYHKTWRKTYTAYQRQKPFFIRYGGILIGYVGFVCATWILWALFRAVGGRSVPPMPRPPTCETCGYNLTAARMDGICPECGVPVVKSLGPDVRPGPAWERRKGVGVWRAYVQSVTQAIFRPTSFGCDVKVTPANTGYRYLFAVHLVLAFVVGLIGISVPFAMAYSDSGYGPTSEEIFGAIAPMLSYFGACIMLVAVMLATVVVAVYYRATHQRNLAGPAAQMACYQSAYLVVWAVLASLVGILVTYLAENNYYREWRRVLQIDAEFLIFLSIVIPNALFALVYLVLIWRGTSGTRYANH